MVKSSPMKKLLLLPFFGCFLLHAAAPESVFVGISGLSSKNLASFQQGADLLTGVQYQGYCHDLQIAHFKVIREVQPTDSVLVAYFKSFGITNFNMKEPVSDRSFMNNCKEFEPRR